MDAFKAELGKRNHRILHRLKLKWKLLHNVEDVAFVQERQNCLLAIKRMQILHSQLTNFTDNLLQLGIAIRGFASCGRSPSCPQSVPDANSEGKTDFYDAAKQLEENSYIVMDMIGDAVLQPLESRIRMLKDMLDLIQDREGVRSDYVYQLKSLARTRRTRGAQSALKQKEQLDFIQHQIEQFTHQMDYYMKEMGGSWANQQHCIDAIFEQFDSILHEHYKAAGDILKNVYFP